MAVVAISIIKTKHIRIQLIRLIFTVFYKVIHSIYNYVDNFFIPIFPFFFLFNCSLFSLIFSTHGFIFPQVISLFPLVFYKIIFNKLSQYLVFKLNIFNFVRFILYLYFARKTYPLIPKAYLYLYYYLK